MQNVGAVSLSVIVHSKNVVINNFYGVETAINSLKISYSNNELVFEPIDNNHDFVLKVIGQSA